VLPTSGQAGIYDGDYAGLIDYNGTNGLRYATGEAHVAIDFNDFNDGDAVQGTISNRRVFNMAGVDITDQVLAQINTEYARGDLDHLGEDLTEIPTLVFRVGPGAIDANGEIRGILDNTLLSRESGSNVNYETGNYYAIVAGPNAEELVGIIVVESSLPGAGNITARETGGFIAYR
jgi:hypothetical protein